MTNAERFLDIFNQIEKHLKSKFNNGYYLPFGDLVRKGSAKEGVIKRFREELLYILICEMCWFIINGSMAV